MDAKLNHSDLSALLAKQGGLSVAKAEVFTKTFFDVLTEGLEKDGVVKINGLGTFKMVAVASRNSVNVNTGEKFEIKGHGKLTFLPADTLKEKINQPFAMFEPVEVNDDYTDDAAENSDASLAGEPSAEFIPAEDDCVPPSAVVPAVSEPSAAENTAEPSADFIPAEDDCAPPSAVAPAVSEPSAAENTAEPSAEFIPAENDCVPSSAVAPAVSDPSAAENTAEPSAEFIPAEDYCVPSSAVAPAVSDPSAAENTAELPVADNPKKRGRGTWARILPGICLLLLLLGVAYYYIIGVRSQKILTQQASVLVDNIQPSATEAAAAPSQLADTATVVCDMQELLPAFVLTDALLALDLRTISLKDTTLYRATGEMARHKVGSDETLTKISLQYYNDKRLWPYIVSYNKMKNHNQLEIGMEILIPQLQPVE